MATKHSANGEVKALQEDLRRLRADMSELAKALLSSGAEGARDVRDRVVGGAEAGVDRVRELLHSLRSQGKGATARIEEGLTRHPIASLLSAIGLGYLVGRFLDRK